VWLSEATGTQPAKGKVRIFGKGEIKEAQVAEDEVAALVVSLAPEPDPPTVVEFRCPEPLNPVEVAGVVESAFGAPIKQTHVPRFMLRAGARAMSRAKPEMASLMGMALYSDTHAITWTDEPLTSRGIQRRSTTNYLTMVANGPQSAAAPNEEVTWIPKTS
jgi:NADH dehydrogenase